MPAKQLRKNIYSHMHHNQDAWRFHTIASVTTSQIHFRNRCRADDASGMNLLYSIYESPRGKPIIIKYQRKRLFWLIFLCTTWFFIAAALLGDTQFVLLHYTHTHTQTQHVVFFGRICILTTLHIRWGVANDCFVCRSLTTYISPGNVAVLYSRRGEVSVSLVPLIGLILRFGSLLTSHLLYRI